MYSPLDIAKIKIKGNSALYFIFRLRITFQQVQHPLLRTRGLC